MEIELDLSREQQYVWYAAIGIAVVLVLVSLSWLGMPVTPYTEAGTPRALGWNDWRFLQAERAYQRELVILRSYTDQLIEAVNSEPNPVAVQMLAEKILKQTGSGDPALEAARLTLVQAATDARNWSTGTLDRDSALASIQLAVELLQ